MTAASGAGTKKIDEQHLVESGLVVLDITVDDDETAHRVVVASGQHGGN
ncbi:MULTISPECIES: DUF6207 family protein [unclassified Streptomyces]|nr:DUF6207 family protein [Streptomyces sp. YIM 132580]MXG29803.1 hypothetical protein [Streptomyces sp. YIM 132580]